MSNLRRYTSTATRTTLATGISIGSTSLTVTNPSGYPVAPFAIRVGDEGIIVNTVTGGVWKGLERGADGTFATAHSTTEDVNHVALGDDFRNRWLDTRVTRPHGTQDIEFGDTMDPAWVQVTPTGTVTWTEGSGVMSVIGDGVAANDLAVNIKPFPVFPPYRFTSAIRMGGYGIASTVAGLVFTDGTSPSSNAVAMWCNLSGTTNNLTAQQYTGTLTSMGTSAGTANMHFYAPWIHMRLTWAAINLFRCEWSTDGVSWFDFDFSDIFTVFTPTHAGFAFSTWSSSETKAATFEYFRAEAY